MNYRRATQFYIKQSSILVLIKAISYNRKIKYVHIVYNILYGTVHQQQSCKKSYFEKQKQDEDDFVYIPWRKRPKPIDYQEKRIAASCDDSILNVQSELLGKDLRTENCLFQGKS